MEITFVANARIAGYRPGQIYKIDSKDLTPMLRALLAKDRHLALLDPINLDEPNKPVAVAPKVKVVEKAVEETKDDGGTSSDLPKTSGQADSESNENTVKSHGGKRPEASENERPNQ